MNFFMIIIREVWFLYLNLSFVPIPKITTADKNVDSEHIASIKQKEFQYLKTFKLTLSFKFRF